MHKKSMNKLEFFHQRMETLKGLQDNGLQIFGNVANWFDTSKGKATINPWKFKETDLGSLKGKHFAFFLSHSPKIKSGNLGEVKCLHKDTCRLLTRILALVNF